MDKQQQLLEVKRKILEHLVPLVINQGGDPSERADTVLSIIELGNSSADLFDKALSIINTVEDNSLRTDFLMRLLGNVQAELSIDGSSEEALAQPADPVMPQNTAADQSQG